MADAYGKLTGRPGDRHRHPRPGRDARLGRRAHRVPGLDAADPARRPGRRGHMPAARRSRRSTTPAMFGGIAKWVGADRARRARAGVPLRAPSRPPPPGGPGPVVLALPEDMLARGRGGRRRRSRTRCSRPTRAPTTSHALRELLAGAKRPFAIVGGGGWTEQAAADVARLRGGERASGRRRRSAARTTSTTPRASTPATSASAPTRSSRRACATPTCCSWSARGSASRRRAATRSSPPGRPRQTLVHVHAAAEELGRVYQPALGSSPARRSSRRRHGALEPVDSSAWRAADGAGARRLPREPGAHARPRRRPARRGDGVGCASGCPTTRSSRTAPATSPSGRTASTSSAATATQLAPTSGAMGYGVPAAVAAKLVHPDRMVVCFARRRRLPDERARSSRPPSSTSCRSSCSSSTTACTGRSGCTRSGTIPAAPFGTDLVNPDFAALRRGLRRPRRGGRAHGGVRAPRSSGQSRRAGRR